MLPCRCGSWSLGAIPTRSETAAFSHDHPLSLWHCFLSKVNEGCNDELQSQKRKAREEQLKSKTEMKITAALRVQPDTAVGWRTTSYMQLVEWVDQLFDWLKMESPSYATSSGLHCSYVFVPQLLWTGEIWRSLVRATKFLMCTLKLRQYAGRTRISGMDIFEVAFCAVIGCFAVVVQ